MSGRTDTASLLRDWGALLEHDHFVDVSGQHGPGWIDKDIVYPHTERTPELAARIARPCCAAGTTGWSRATTCWSSTT